MIRGAWAWLRGKASGEDASTPEDDQRLEQSEVALHQAEADAAEAAELAASLRKLRAANGFRERMVLKIQGGLR